MATSGAVTLSSTGAEICLTAANILNWYGADVASLPTNDAAYSLRLLNWLMKFTQTQGGFLWKKSVGFVFVQGGQYSYSLGVGGDNATETYATTLTTATAAVGATTLTVSSSSGMTTGDYILIPLSTNTYQRTTITVSGTTLTLGTGTSEAISSGTRIYTFTSFIEKPIRVYAAAKRKYDGVVTNTYTVTPVPTETFDDMYTKFSNQISGGEPTRCSYLPQRTLGRLDILGNNTDLTRILVIIFEKQIQDLSVGTNEPDYPNEWFIAMGFMLAYLMSFSLAIPADIRKDLKENAMWLFNSSLGGDVENAPLRVDRGYSN